MPPASVGALLLALCPRGSLAVEDAGALVQVRRDGEPGSSVLVERVKSAFAPKTGKLDLSWGPACEQSDLFGSKRCALPGGQPANVTLRARLPGGRQRGDTIAGACKVDMTYADELSIWSDVLPTSGTVSGKCELCEGVCFGEARAGGLRLWGSAPTPLRDPAACSKPAGQDFALCNRSFVVPKSYLEGEAECGLELAREGYEGEATGIWRVKAQAPPVSKPVERPSLMSKVAKRLVSSVRDETVRRAKAHEPPLVTQRSPPPATVERARTGPGKVTMDLTYTQTAGAIYSNISIAAGSYCSSKDSAGSVVCTVPMETPFEYSVTGGLKLATKSGDVFKYFAQVRAEGEYVQITLPPVEFQVPVCGAPAMNISIMGQDLPYEPPPCGEYMVNVATDAPVQVTIPDIGAAEIPQDPSMPVPPMLVRDLYPITVNTTGDFYGADGSHLYGVSIKLTFDD